MNFAGAAVFVDDVPATLDFYRRAFGFTVRPGPPSDQYGDLDTGGANLGVASHALGEAMMPGRYRRPQADVDASFGVELAFVTDDVPAAFERATAAGAQAVSEPTDLPWGGTAAYVRAPEGTLIVLHTPPAASANPEQ